MKQFSVKGKLLLVVLATIVFGGVLFFGPSANASTVIVTSTISSNTTWLGSNVYIVDGFIDVASSATLTVQSGTVVKFNGSYAGLLIDGKLIVNGVASKKVYFTSINDNSIGGTNGSSTGNPAPGDWEAIQGEGSSTITLTSAVVRYGGNPPRDHSGGGDIIIDNGTTTITSSQISSSSNEGLFLTGGSTKVTTSTISNNSNNGVLIAYLNYQGYNNPAYVSFTLATSTISGDGRSAIEEFYQVGNLTITGSSINNNTNYDGSYIDVTGGVNFVHSGNNASGTHAGWAMYGTTATNTTWAKDAVPYMPNGMIIASGTTLTINHGVVVKPLSFLVNQGTLNIQGTSTDPVYFTSINDNSVGGVSNGSSTSTPSPGDWGAIQNDGGNSTITNAILRYGGMAPWGYSSSGDVLNDAGTVTISNSQLSSSSNDGLFLTGGSAIIMSSTVTNNIDTGIYISQYQENDGPVAASSSISSSTISNNGQYGILEIYATGTLAIANSSLNNNGYFYGDANIDLRGLANFIPTNDTATGTIANGFIVSGALATSTTWKNGGLPYIIEGITVSSGTTLTIGPSTFIKFSQGSSLDVAANGILNVNPNPDIENGTVYFTSLTDNSIFPGTNGTSTNPQPGDSGYIEVESGASSSISGADILYGGAYPGYSNIYQTGGTLHLYNVSIASSSNYGFYSTGGTSTFNQSQFFANPEGIFMTGGNVNVASSDFEGNAYDGVANGSDVTSTATAKNNYWNSFSGPYNANSNPGGTGDPVSDYVNFTPFINNNGARSHYLITCYNASSTPVFCSSVKSSSTLIYYASTTYSTAWNTAVNTFNTLASSTSGGIKLSSTTLASSTGYLKVSDVNLSDVGWVGLWTHDPNPNTPSSTIQFNKYFANTYPVANLQNLTTHELGHGLGLDDEGIISNVEFIYNTAQFTLGSQDLSDYDYLW